MGGKRPQATCHPARPHNSKGLCKSCYDKIHNKKPHIIQKRQSLERKAYEKAYAKSSKRKIYERNYYKSKGKENIKAYKKSNKGAETRRRYDSLKRKNNIQFKLANNIRSRLYKGISNKAGSSVQDLGCSIAELKVYLESLFQSGMSWDNYGPKGWHIDHIVPLASFDLTDREQFLKACHYSNLQPLWASDNLKKGSKDPSRLELK